MRPSAGRAVARTRSLASTGPRRARRSALVAAGLCLLAVAGAGGAGVALTSCGGTQSNAVTAAEHARTVLGRAPRGLAAEIIKRGSIVFAVGNDMPPLAYKNKSGTLMGFDVAVAKEIAKQLRLTPTFVTPVPEEAPHEIKAGNADVGVGVVPPDSGEGIVQESKPYMYSKGQLLVATGKPALTGVAGATVGAAIQSVFYDWLKDQPSAKAVSYASDADAITALEAGQVQAVLTDALTAQGAVKAKSDLQLSGDPLFASPVRMAVKKGQKDLLTLLNSTVADLRASGWLSSASRAWFGGLDLATPALTGASPSPSSSP